jgi:SAM-dependent MidA family methyltransferase
MSALLPRLLDTIRQHGPLTVAQFMERALYDVEHGYYTGAAQRSGRHGDFFTSVDAGPLFGRCLAAFVDRAWRALDRPARLDLVEVAAGNGRLMRDLLDGLAMDAPDALSAVRVHLVERSAPARAQHADRLGPHAPRVVASAADLPPRVDGVLLANELLDAFPVHRVVMTDQGLREAHVVERDGRLALAAGPLSSAGLATYFERLGVALAPGTVADISPAAVSWVAEAGRRLARGAMLLVDYGHEAGDLFSPRHANGTLVSFARHQLDSAPGGDTPGRPAWLDAPGARDLTAHVDFTSVASAATSTGCTREWLVDQTTLLLGLGLADFLVNSGGDGLAAVRTRLAATTLVSPVGLGASHRALMLSRQLADPARRLALLS